MSFSLHNLGTDKFAINTNTGAVTVAGDLDHEQTVGYTLSVEARENLGVPVSTPDTVSDTCLLMAGQ